MPVLLSCQSRGSDEARSDRSTDAATRGFDQDLQEARPVRTPKHNLPQYPIRIGLTNRGSAITISCLTLLTSTLDLRQAGSESERDQCRNDVLSATPVRSLLLQTSALRFHSRWPDRLVPREEIASASARIHRPQRQRQEEALRSDDFVDRLRRRRNRAAGLEEGSCCTEPPSPAGTFRE